MNHKLTWKLEIIDLKEFARTNERFHCTDVQTFFTLADVWHFLGFKLKRERCGYAGIRGDAWYVVTKM